MLKIKDSVALKELEKFGFEFYEEYNEWFYYGFTRPSDTSEIRINIRNDNRNIHPSFDFNVNLDSIYDKIYDLIQARISRKSLADTAVRRKYMCEYCEKDKIHKSCNFCGSAKMRISVSKEMTILEIQGDKEKFSLFKRIYCPRFDINYCPMCRKRVERS